MENGLVNLVAVVGFLIFAISLVPLVLFLGSPSKRTPSANPDHD